METNYKASYLIRRLLREHIRPYRKKLVIAVLCMIVVATTTAANAWMIRPALDEIFVNKNAHMLVIIPLAVLFITGLGACANYGNIVNMRYADPFIRASHHQRHRPL